MNTKLIIIIWIGMLLFIMFGCSSNYRSPIIDIRDELNIDCATPKQPEQFQKIIIEFKP